MFAIDLLSLDNVLFGINAMLKKISLLLLQICMIFAFLPLSSYSKNSSFVLDNLYKYESDRKKIEFIFSTISDFDYEITEHTKDVIDTARYFINKSQLYEYLPELYLSYGIHYLNKSSYLKSTDYLIKALKEIEKTDNDFLKGRIYRQLGENYRATSNYDKSLEYLSDAQEIFTELNDSLYLARTYNRFSAVYYEFYNNNDLIKSIDYANRSNEIALILNDTALLINNYNILGACYSEMSKENKAIEYLKKAVEMSDTLYSPDYPIYLFNIAKNYHYLGEYEKSIEYGLKGYHYALERDMIRPIADLSYVLTINYDSLGDFKKAYHYKTIQLNSFDSLFKAAEKKAILEFEEKYKHEQNQQKIHTQEMQQKYQLLIFSVVGVSLLVIVLVYYRKQKQLAVNNKMLSELNKRISYQNEELNNLNKTKDKFFSIIAHDLKNPIAALRNLSQLMSEEFGNLERSEQIEFIHEIKNTSSNLFDLLENLLVWSRSQSGRIRYEPENIDVCYIIQSNIDLMKITANRKNINLKAKGDCPLFIKVDHNMITTVIRNILSNAIKFTEEGGEISVSHHETDREIVISIKDNGMGMSKEIKENLFKIDVTVTTLGTNEERGTGLGLIICKEFIDKHDGNIEVESTPGEGSTFIITLPKK